MYVQDYDETLPSVTGSAGWYSTISPYVRKSATENRVPLMEGWVNNQRLSGARLFNIESPSDTVLSYNQKVLLDRSIPEDAEISVVMADFSVKDFQVKEFREKYADTIFSAPHITTPDQDSIGRLLLILDPSNALVTVDGEIVLHGSYQFRFQPSTGIRTRKKVRVVVTADGYKPATRDVELEPGNLLFLPVTLEKAAHLPAPGPK